jgi:hypothetical protein
MYKNNGSRNQQSYWPRGQEHNGQSAFPTSRFNSRDYPSQSAYTQRDVEYYRAQYNTKASMTVAYEHDTRASQQNWVDNATMFQSQHNSLYQTGNITVYNTQFGSYGGNTLNQSQISPFGDHQSFQQSNIPCLTVDSAIHQGYNNFQPTNVPTHLNQMPLQNDSFAQTSVNQENSDKLWLKHWLEQCESVCDSESQTITVNKPKKSLKVSDSLTLGSM